MLSRAVSYLMELTNAVSDLTEVAFGVSSLTELSSGKPSSRSLTLMSSAISRSSLFRRRMPLLRPPGETTSSFLGLIDPAVTAERSILTISVNSEKCDDYLTLLCSKMLSATMLSCCKAS